jgi:hypothetical protein
VVAVAFFFNGNLNSNLIEDPLNPTEFEICHQPNDGGFVVVSIAANAVRSHSDAYDHVNTVASLSYGVNTISSSPTVTTGTMSTTTTTTTSPTTTSTPHAQQGLRISEIYSIYRSDYGGCCDCGEELDRFQLQERLRRLLRLW